MRASGILLPLFSLPSPYGIGSLGKEAFRFIDFLQACQQSCWQLLPLNPTSPCQGNSPYSALSSFAGSPYLIDLDQLAEEGLLFPEDYEHLDFGQNAERVDYEKVCRVKDLVLRKAFLRFSARTPGRDYAEFLERNDFWLDHYVLFQTLSLRNRQNKQASPADKKEQTSLADENGRISSANKDRQAPSADKNGQVPLADKNEQSSLVDKKEENAQKRKAGEENAEESISSFCDPSWEHWEAPFKYKEGEVVQAFSLTHSEEIHYQIFLQYEFFKQYDRVKKYAHAHGIQLIGDLAIYVPYDSADCWAWPDLFQLDEHLHPLAVSGVPPDAYSQTGQLWGHPLYDWEKMAQDGYNFWIERLRMAQRLYDYIRLDHFIGFSRYYAIAYGEKTAEHGQWRPGPGRPFFDRLYQELDDLHLIAEDLGSVTESVVQLKKELGLPGMRVLQFAFEGTDSPHFPDHYTEDCIAYSSTHDSDSFLGWLTSLAPDKKQEVIDRLGLDPEEGYHWGAIRKLLTSSAGLTIFPMQDLLGQGSEGRINTPGQAEGNWEWRLPPGYGKIDLIERMRAYMDRFGSGAEETFFKNF